MPFYHIRAKERAKYATLLHCRTGQKYRLNTSDKMATQGPQNELNFALYDLDFQTDELFTEMDFLTEQTETSETVNVAVITEEREQTEINGQQLDDQDVDNFIVENRNKNTTKKTQSDLDKVVAHFFFKVRKQNGDEYEPDTLTQLTAFCDKINNTIYSPTDSLQRPEKLYLQNVSSFAV